MQEQERRRTLRTHAQAEIIMDDDEEEMEKPIAVEEMKEEMKESQLNDSEIEMAGEVLVQLCVNEACGLSLLSKEGIVDVVKCGEFLIELIVICHMLFC